MKTGGLEQQGPVPTVTIEGAGTAVASLERIRLQRSRAFYTATMLPDGKVLILGGIGGDGRVVDTAEIYDPETRSSELLATSQPPSAIRNPQSEIVPRVYHTAILLTEGFVLIAGGVSSDGEALKTAELWDFRARRIVARLKLRTARYNPDPLYGRDWKGGYRPRGIPVKDPKTGKTVRRGDMFLHVGSASIGCVTVPSQTSKWNPFNKYPQSDEYSALKRMLDGSSPYLYNRQNFSGKVTVR